MAWILDDLTKVEAAIAAAEKYVDGKGVPLTVERLAFALGVDRNTLGYIAKGEYNEKPVEAAAMGAVKRAYAACAASVTEHGMMRGNNPAMPIFNLINNHGHSNKIEHSGDAMKVIFMNGDKVQE